MKTRGCITIKKHLCLTIAVLLVVTLCGCVPKDIPSAKIISIAVGDSFSFAIDSDGNLWAWGSNESGQLGDGTTKDRLSPVKIIKGFEP